ncbi:probable sucrose-phosphate synthase [Rosa chinensis]|uniref:probable sucrose-phosphate synthase n=1 Tax=Rosa chinensis TaxID=74649 RepID=UPI000D096EC2|nr:probable sucrose-phosphate synthase [Rosa chinensis]
MQTLIMGNRDEIDDFSSTSASVLLSVLKLTDEHDLYRQVACPKHHKQSDVPDIYCLAAKTKLWGRRFFKDDQLLRHQLLIR